MTPEQIETEAKRLVRDHLEDGIEFLSISDSVGQAYGSVSEDDVQDVSDLVDDILSDLSRTLGDF